MMWAIYLASFVSSRSAENIACAMWFGFTFEVSATHAFLGCMLDFEHKQTA